MWRVTWSATAGTVNSSGLFTAPTVSSPTSVTVTATSLADTSKSSSAAFTVNPAPSVLAVSPASLSFSGQVGASNLAPASVSITIQTRCSLLSWIAPKENESKAYAISKIGIVIPGLGPNLVDGSPQAQSSHCRRPRHAHRNTSLPLQFQADICRHCDPAQGGF
jgi:hypothetical protein